MSFLFKYIYLPCIVALMCWSSTVQSTIVEIRTELGTFEVNLFDNATPETVANFLSYVNSGAFANNVVHRSIPGFIVQAGGFQYTGPITGVFTLDEVAVGDAVINEPRFSNVRGTIAMAKIPDLPNSATSEWFINVSNNSGNLDIQNAGFTVFGQVVGDGMQVVDAIANLSRLSAGGFNELPIRNYTQTDVDNETPITDDNLIVISDIVVTNSATDTAADLNPELNTLINAPNSGGGSGSGGGAMGPLLLLTLLCLRRKRF
jgi:peptidyl-prolyl cis-trans isomerase A (cyclophilin A)